MASDDEQLREVAHQAAIGAFNRRAFLGAQNFDQYYAAAGFEPGTRGEFICTCGRSDCDKVLALSLDEYRFVQEKPYRFLVASGHATDVDDVIRSAGDYEVVEIKPEYRDVAESIIETRGG